MGDISGVTSEHFIYQHTGQPNAARLILFACWPLEPDRDQGLKTMAIFNRAYKSLNGRNWLQPTYGQGKIAAEMAEHSRSWAVLWCVRN